MLAISFLLSFLNSYRRLCHLLGVKPCAYLSAFLSFGQGFLSCSFKKWSRESYKETALVFITLMRFLLQSSVSSDVIILLKQPFPFFPLSPLIWWCLQPIFLSTCNFLFFSLLVCMFYRFDCSVSSTVCLLSLFFEDSLVFNAKFYHYTLAIYSLFFCFTVSSSFSFLRISLYPLCT